MVRLRLEQLIEATLECVDQLGVNGVPNPNAADASRSSQKQKSPALRGFHTQ